MRYERPEELLVSQERTAVEGACPECASERLHAYPVLSEGGWFNVVKCRACLHSVERVADPIGPTTILSTTI
jgi:hypothetical protein